MADMTLSDQDDVTMGTCPSVALYPPPCCLMSLRFIQPFLISPPYQPLFRFLVCLSIPADGAELCRLNSAGKGSTDDVRPVCLFQSTIMPFLMHLIHFLTAAVFQTRREAFVLFGRLPRSPHPPPSMPSVSPSLHPGDSKGQRSAADESA